MLITVYLHYLSLPRAREALRQCLPEQLKDSTFAATLKDDSTTKKWLSQLLHNLSLDSSMLDPRVVAPASTTVA